jgi:hypothetical protein
VWLELKTVSKQAMPMFPNKHSWLTDFYHCLGSYWAVEEGLFRTDDDDGIQSFLFPNLHNMKNNSVTTKCTNIIKRVLPPGTPTQLKSQYSAKGFRKAAVSTLLNHPELNAIGDICGRTGHHTKTSLPWYDDKSNPLRAVRGGKALAGWENVRGMVQPPRFMCLSNGTRNVSVDHFIEKLFVISLPAFKPGGQLYTVLEICGASLVMYHNTVTRDLGPSNVVSTKLRDAARAADIKDPSHPVDSPENILDRWSDQVLADFNSRNPEIAEATPDTRSLTLAVNQLTHIVNVMSGQMQQLVLDNKRRDMQYEHQQQYLAFYSKQLLQRENENIQLRAQLASARSNNIAMQTALQSPPRFMPQENSMSQNLCAPLPTSQPTFTSQPSAASDSSTTQPLPIPPTQQQPTSAPTAPTEPTTHQQQQQRPSRPLIWTSHAAASDNADSKSTISEVLVKMYDLKRLREAQWKDVSVPDCYSHKSNVRYTLELCQYVMTADEKRLFSDSEFGQNRNHLLSTAAEIQTRSFRKLWELEGLNPIAAEQTNRMAGSRAKKPTYGAVGTRVMEVKKKLPGGVKGPLHLPEAPASQG